MFNDEGFLNDYLRTIYPELSVKYIKVGTPDDYIHNFVMEAKINGEVIRGKSETSLKDASRKLLEVVNERFN